MKSLLLFVCFLSIGLTWSYIDLWDGIIVKQTKVPYYAVSNISHQLEGLLIQPRSTSKKQAAIIMFHHFMGRDKFTDQEALKLAQEGYVVFAADTYGKGVATKSVEDNFAIMAQVLEQRTTTLKDRILAAWQLVSNLPYVDKNRIGTVGYCYGGLVSLDLARFDIGVKAAVSFHGTLTNYPENSFKKTRTVIQAHHGDADVHTNETHVIYFLDEMRKRNTDWHFVRYGLAQHAFTFKDVDSLNIPGAKYDKKAAKRSWTSMLQFLREFLV